MNNPNGIVNKNYHVKIIFILSIIISLIKIESIVYSTINYQKYREQTTTELVVHPIHNNAPGFCKLFSSSDDPVSIHYSNHENISFSRFALFYYNNFLQSHYKIFKNKFISQIDFVSILHKHNISHRAPDEDSLLLI
jgi:hypothetical protein